LVRKKLFRFPFGFILDMGGEPLDRSGGLNKVDSIAAFLTGRKFFVWQLLRRNEKKLPN
jgi:hypothetical protein